MRSLVSAGYPSLSWTVCADAIWEVNTYRKAARNFIDLMFKFMVSQTVHFHSGQFAFFASLRLCASFLRQPESPLHRLLILRFVKPVQIRRLVSATGLSLA